MTFDPESRRQAIQRHREFLREQAAERGKKSRMGDVGKAIGVVIIILFAGLAIFWTVKSHNDWKDSCVARGGHVSSHTNWRNNSSDTDTTYYCLNNNGGIIDIR